MYYQHVPWVYQYYYPVDRQGDSDPCGPIGIGNLACIHQVLCGLFHADVFCTADGDGTDGGTTIKPVPMVAHPNGALVPEDKPEVVAARKEHLAAVEMEKKREENDSHLSQV